MIHLLNLLCGIGLFLFGMDTMSRGAQKLFDEKMKSMLSLMTNTKLKAIITGAAVTGIIQSSSVVTVTAARFVDSGLLSLYEATGIILGANIGTTVTSLLIAFNFSSLAPLIVFLGAVVLLVSQKEKHRNLGEILVGFGILFLGLNTMSGAFSHLKENQDFLNFLVYCAEGKLKGIVAGIFMTAVIQSSSASVGILQSLCLQGLISVESGIYIVLGQNIGTVLTSLISVIGKSKGARQASMVHLVFNVLGAMFFILLCEVIPVAQMLSYAGNESMQISAFHIVFNIITVILIIPFYDLLIKISGRAMGVRLVRTK